ncbi:hypothetical protein D9M73_209770 [compost metagenome]
MDAQWLFGALGRGGLGFGCTARCLGDQQIIDVGGAVFVDDEARVRLLQADFGNRQGIAVTVFQTVEIKLLPFDEVAALEGVEGV